ncbi:serine protease persephone-like isoform X2 [Contarinia nasturtii]|uniref:serine protease persephone-like isoform X2 n=1 Tax=Contarinia nasturtii TaxID=265458 RepID=UPI0012D41F25|nr:serine protease persephone-like isoform X2 [Contarinia nasturtii]
MIKLNFLVALLFFCFEVCANSDLDNRLTSAAVEGNIETIKTLINDGANVNFEDEYKHTPLHWAAVQGHAEIIKYLIEKGVNVNVENLDKNTPIHWAAWNGHKEAVKTLIDHGANVNAEDKDKATPLHKAAENGHTDTVKYLVNHGANVTARNNQNKTPLEVALKLGQEGVKLLTKPEKTSKTKNACSQFPRIEPVTSRIIGGDVAEKGEFPWMAALVYMDNFKLSFGCSGTIISEFYVMTAAHCARKRRPPVAVRLGKVNVTDESRSNYQTDYYIANIRRHPNYSSFTKKNDIALLRLTVQIYFTNTIRPACLHTDMGDIDNSTKVIVTGWGITDPEKPNSQSNELLKIKINTMPLSECNTIYTKHDVLKNEEVFHLDIGQYCAYDPAGIKDSCQGDSGGPLQHIPNNDANEATIVAIVSFGNGCGLKLPGIYTRVSHYINWIESVVWP